MRVGGWELGLLDGWDGGRMGGGLDGGWNLVHFEWIGGGLWWYWKMSRGGGGMCGGLGGCGVGGGGWG